MIFIPTLLISVAVGVSILYSGVVQAYSTEGTLLENTITLAYGIGDLLLVTALVFVLRIVLEYKEGKLFTPWMLMFLAFLATLVADYIYIFQYEAYEIGENIILPLLDILWSITYFLLAVAFIKMREVIDDATKNLSKYKQ